MTNKLYAPNIHLFAFHLRSELAADCSLGDRDDNLLWEKCDRIFEKLKIENLKLSEKLSTHQLSDSPRLDLLDRSEIKNDNVSLPFEGNLLLDNNQLVKIVGFAYPQQTHDSYALWLNLRRPDRENGHKTQDVEMSVLGKLNPDNCLLPEFIDSSLGQTLLIAAWLTEGQNYQDKQVLKAIADQCIQHFIADPDKHPAFNREGLLFGSPIFEYGIVNQPDPYCHILVWLFSNSVTEIKLNKCYAELMDLFYYRNKVVRAYKNSRYFYKLVEEAYLIIEKEIVFLENLPKGEPLKKKDLERFKNLLTLVPSLALKYFRFLQELERCSQTIGLNAGKYEEKIEGIQKKLQADNLSFLEVFCKKNCLYLQEQIQADLRYFERGAGLLEKILSAIRGMVEIERALSDRRQQETTIWLGIGIATGVVVAAGSVHITPENPIQPPFTSRTLHPFAGWLIAIAFCGVVAGAIARWLAKLSS